MPPLLLALLQAAAMAQAPDTLASNAFIQIGAIEGVSSFPTAVVPISDVTGDGRGDLLISSSNWSSNRGKVWIVSSTSGAIVDYAVGNNSGNQFGFAMAANGNFNNANGNDVVIGSPGYSSGTEVELGKIEVFTLLDGNLIIAIPGVAPGDRMGEHVAFLGNVDGNPGDEIAILSDVSNSLGMPETQVRSFSTQMPLVAMFEGRYVSNAGLINNDMFTDIVIGMPHNTTNGVDAGFLEYRDGNTGASISPASGPTSVPGELLGSDVRFMGDLSTDGLGDALASSPGFDSGRGQVRVISGELTSLPDVPNHPDLRVFTGEAIGDAFGAGIANLGDVNGDSIDDIAVGAPMNDTLAVDAGRVYVYSGATGALLHTFTGERAGVQFGAIVSAAGDFNGDGTNDIVITAPNDTNGAGKLYIFLMPRPCPADLNRDGIVNGSDLAILLVNWGPCPPPANGPCLADLTGDSMVDGADLAALLVGWGPCPPPQGAPAMAGDPGGANFGSHSTMNPGGAPAQQSQSQSGEAFMLGVLGQFGFTDLDSYYIWLNSTSDAELAAHISAIIDAILRNMQ